LFDISHLDILNKRIGRPSEATLRFNVSCAAVILTLASAHPLCAQEEIENSEMTFYVRTSGGVPAVCGFDFILVYRDNTYRQGALAGVRGSLEWLEGKGNVGLLLKISGLDFPNAAKQDMTAIPFYVAQGFVVVSGHPYAPLNSRRCEQPTALCASYQLPNSVLIQRALIAGNLAVGFNREAKGLDISLPLDPRDGIRGSPNEFRAYSACMAALADRAAANLNK
jgi:hypothetical protein